MNKNNCMKWMLFSLTFTLTLPAHAGLTSLFSNTKKKIYQLPSDKKPNAKKKSGKKGFSLSFFAKLPNFNFKNLKDSRVSKAFGAIPGATWSGIKKTKRGVASGLSISYTFLKSDTGKELLKVGVPLAIVMVGGGYYLNRLNNKLDRLENKSVTPPYDDQQVRQDVQGVRTQVTQLNNGLPQNIATQADFGGIATAQNVQNATENLATKDDLTAVQGAIDDQVTKKTGQLATTTQITVVASAIYENQRHIQNLTQVLTDQGLTIPLHASAEALTESLNKFNAIPKDTFKITNSIVAIGTELKTANLTRVVQVEVLKKNDGNFFKGSYAGSWTNSQQVILDYAKSFGNGTCVSVVGADGVSIHSETIT